MPDPAPAPSGAELDVLNVLWRRGPLTVRDVHAEISQQRDVGYTTVLKTMQIMAEKGLVRRDESSRSHVYIPVAKETQVKQRLITDLLDKAFAGSAADLVAHALGARKASAEDIRRIRQLLDEKRGGAK
jgi:predicted transcriptional regulator